MTYGYCANLATADCATNNGNMQQQAVDARTWSFGYDGASRLTSVGSSDYAQTYAYDQWGNRALVTNTPGSTVATVPSSISHYDPATNRIRQSVFPSVHYDAAGNMDVTTAGEGLTYDAENRITQYVGGKTIT